MKITVNRRLLPIKAHYFFFWGGLSGSMPFLTLIAKSLGITATAVGFMSLLYPFFALLAKPLFGVIADHFKKLKFLMTSALIFTFLFCLAMIFIPPITNKYELPTATLLCSLQGYELGIPTASLETCPSDLSVSTDSNFTADCTLCNHPAQILGSDYSEISSENLNCSGPAYKMYFLLSNTSQRSYSNVWFPVNDMFVDKGSHICDDAQFYLCRMSSMPGVHDQCATAEAWHVYYSHQFWLFLIFFIFARTGMSVLISLSDAMCFELLQGRFDLYGQQRMWGAIGWGIFSLVGGYFLTLTAQSDFSPGIYMTIVLLIIDAIIVNFADVKTSQSSGRLLKDLGKLLKKVQVIVFLIFVFFMGFLTGIQWTYFFWFLYNLQATKLLISIILAVQTFLGELPSFFISGKLIGKVGFENALSISFCAFGVRFILYSYIQNPWYVLPVELFQGPTFGIFYSAMAMYAKSVAIPGTEASMQGLVGGTFEGLGVAIGGLLSGVAFDLFGGHHMFRIASIIAFSCCFLNYVSYLIFRRLQTSAPAPDRRREQIISEESSFLQTPTET